MNHGSALRGLFAEELVSELLNSMFDKSTGPEVPAGPANTAGDPGSAARDAERYLLSQGVDRLAILKRLAEHYGVPFIEYDEALRLPEAVFALLDPEGLKRGLWFPLSVRAGVAKVAAFDPGNALLPEEVKRTLRVDRIEFVAALPSDIIRMIENNQDINPGFTPDAGRTPLAALRTWLAGERTVLAGYRTTLAKGRTGLALIRTGVSFLSIGLVMLRIFGFGLLTVLEALLALVGLIMATDGVRWYVPARRIDVNRLDYVGTEPTFGTTILQVDFSGGKPEFSRTAAAKDAESLRPSWNRLSPVMKRRFLAIDRTDLAEERTILANYRTRMARARTGLAFMRTGISFIGLGIAFFRQFHAGPWSIFDASLILSGIAMVSEGFHWYIPGRKAGEQGIEAVEKAKERSSIWDFMFPPVHRQPLSDDHPAPFFMSEQHAPGIWGTTGLALERTLIADRRNVKSRLRTIMARSRTGMAFIRTGISILSVGSGLLVYFGAAGTAWVVFNLTLIVIGLVFITDGLYWHIPAERMRNSFSHCLSDMEIPIVDYGKPSGSWRKAVFSHEDI